MLLNPVETGSGRKRKSSDESVDSRKEPRTGVSLFSPGTVSKEFSTLSLASTSGMENTTEATRVEMANAPYTEAVLFSLRVDGLPSSEGHEVEGYQEPPKWVDVRDIVFRDHDSLALLLGSSDTDQHGCMDQQYLILMPLEPHKYTAADVISDITGTSLLDRLTVANPSSEILALPISMSRNVTQSSMMDTSFISTSSVSHGVPDESLDKTNALVGPCRIACNERGKSQVLSIHGPLQPGAQGAGRITIFDL